MAGSFLFIAWWRERENPTKDWPWYRSREFKYRLRYPPDWLVEPGWIEDKEGKQIYLVSPQEKQAEEENLAICEGKKEGICEPEMPPGGIFVEVIEKSGDQDLESWFAEEYKDSEVYKKENFEVRIIKGIKAETDGLYSEFNIFLAQPSYILRLSQFFQETPELSLVAKSVTLPEEREMVGGRGIIYYIILWAIVMLIILGTTRFIVKKS